jgi:DNA-binding transcriptional LysR family regulator
MQVMDWDDLRYVLAAARTGTLAAAARRLDVDQTTVARRLAAAQSDIGARLFDRRDGRLQPTAAGLAAIARAERVEQEVGALESAIAGSDAVTAGAVRITAVPILVDRLLIPAAQRFCAQHPGLRLELIGEPRNLSLTRREADIALRLARPDRGTALARRIGRLDYAVFASRRRGADTLPWITYEDGLAHLPQAQWTARAARSGTVAPLQVNDAEAIVQAVRAGLGRALLPCFLAGREPGLVQIGKPVLARELWLLVHPELRPLARIAAAIAWLEATVRPSRARPAPPPSPSSR